MSLSTVDSGPLHVKPKVDLNIATEANRILYVLNKLINRAKFAGLLKNLTGHDGNLLKGILDEASLNFVLQTCQRYSIISANAKLIGSRANDEVESDAQDKSSHSGDSNISESELEDDKDVIKTLYTLEENSEIQNLVNNKKENSPQMHFLITCLTEFKNLVENRLQESAAQFKTREKYLRDVYSRNEKVLNEIVKMEEALIVTKTDANVCLIGKNILIKRHQNKIEKIKRNSLEVIEKKVNESEKTMVNDWKNSVIQQERLQNDYSQASEKYSHLLRDHLTAEKVLRAKRTKLENQVLGWIQKYDQEIGEKQAEEEEIQALLDKESEEVHEIQRKLDEQGDEYDELMQEKADYEEEILERRLYQFIVNRSARRIQKTYRLYKARKLARKLAKKGKKGKKKE